MIEREYRFGAGKDDPPVQIYLKLKYDSEDIRLSNPLTSFDREVSDAVATLWAAGHGSITPSQVYRCIFGMEEPGAKALLTVVESIDKLRRTLVGDGHIEDIEVMLAASKVIFTTTDGEERVGYIIHRAPALYQRDVAVAEVNGRRCVPERYCCFTPSETERRLDENDVEHDTGEPSDECPTFVCSACGSDMMYGDGGWFDLEPPHKPRFGYCPYCGAKVVQKEVG